MHAHHTQLELMHMHIPCTRARAARETCKYEHLSPGYNGKIYFMHGSLCPAVARALRAQIVAGTRCGGGAQGLVVRTLMRALVLEDAQHAQCSV
jgi:hypothetical protein